MVYRSVLSSGSIHSKGFSQVLAAAMMVTITVGAAGSYYAFQGEIVDEAKEEPELFTDVPVTIESCWANETGMYVSIANAHNRKTLDTKAVELYTGNERLESEPSKDYVEPNQNFKMYVDRYIGNTVEFTAETKTASDSELCTEIVPEVNPDFTHSPQPVVEGDTATFTEETEGVIAEYTWYRDGTQIGTGKDVDSTLNNPDNYNITLEVEDVLNKSGSKTKTIDVLEEAFFDVSAQSDNSPVEAGNTLTVNYKVENTGEAENTKDIILEVEGNQKDSETKTLEGGEQATGSLSWSTTTGDIGTQNYRLKTEDSQDSRTAEVLEPAFFAITGSSHNSPVQAGNSFNVNYQIENTGEAEDTKQIALEIDGTVTETKSHTLSGGETVSDTVSWTTTTDDIGDHSYKIRTEDDQKSGSMTVEDPKVLQADFSYSPGAPRVDDTIDFSDTSNVEDTTVSERRWDFGDGNTATGSNPSHSYSSSGTFTVELEIEDEDGDTDTKTKTIDVFSCDDVFSVGSGTDSDPYEVSNVNELQDIEKCPDKVFELVNNIDASGTSSWNGGDGFDPISGFTGKLLGNNYKISDLYIHRSSQNKVGLFSNPDGSAVIKNLDITDADMYNGNTADVARRVGILAGEIESGVKVTNVDVSGSVECDCGGGSVQAGGFIGFIKGPVKDSEADVTVESNGARAGGFTATIGDEGTVKKSVSRGTVNGGSTAGGFVGLHSGDAYNSESYADVNGNSNVGGFVGDFGGANSDPYIDGSKAHGDVQGDDYVGGFAGKAGTFYGSLSDTRVIENSEATGSVTGDEYVGGFTGYHARLDNKISGSHAEGSVSGNNHVGGFVGQAGDENQESDENPKILSSTWDQSGTGQSEGVGTIEKGDGDVTVELTSN